MRNIIMFALLLGLVTGSSAFAQEDNNPDPNAYQDYILSDPTVLVLADAGLLTSLDMTNTTDHGRVTVDFAYADAHQIYIGYTYEVEVLGLFYGGASASASVATADGVSLTYAGPQGGGSGGGGGGAVVEEPALYTAAGTDVYIGTLPTSEETVTDDEISLVVDVFYIGTSDIEGETVEGETTFTFTVPFYSATEIDVESTETVDGIDLTLTTISIVPSGARLELCLNSESIIWQDVAGPVMTLVVDGTAVGTRLPDLNTTYVDGDTACRPYPLRILLEEPAGEWMLTVDSLFSATQPDTQTLVDALIAEGIEAQIAPSGIGFALDTSDVRDARAYFDVLDRTNAIDASLRETWDGPWTFTFSVP